MFKTDYQKKDLYQLQNMKKLILILTGFFLFNLSCFPATITSNTTGNWNTGSTWVGGIVPSSTDDVVIAATHTVTINTTDSCKNLTVNGTSASSFGTLNIETGGTLSTSAHTNVYGKLNINGGTFNEGDSAGDKLTINGNSLGSSCLFFISSGILNVSRYFALTNSSSFKMTGGTINVNSTGGSSGTDIFYIPSGTTFDMSGGDINILNGNKGTGVAFKFNPSTSNVTGGTIKITNTKDYSTTTIVCSNDLWNINCNVNSVGSDNTLVIQNMPSSTDGFICNDFTITSGIVRIDENTKIKINGTSSLGSDDQLTIASGASVIFGTAPTRKIKIERDVTAWVDATHGWHFISSPITSQAIQPEFVPNPPTSSEDFYKWDETTHYWINSKSSPGTWNTSFESNFVQGRGYLVAYGSDVTKTFDGVVTASDLAITGLTKTTFTPTWSTEGWNLIGNPYTSGLTWDVGNWTSTNIDGTAKIWNESSASYTDIPDGSGIIPPMQGFMVHVNNTSGGSLTLDASDRVHNTTWYKEDSVVTNKIKLTVYDTEGNTAQESIIRIDENATEGFDAEFDSHFLAGYAPQFYSVLEDGTAVSTNVLPELADASAIPFSFIKNNSSAFYIHAKGINDLIPAHTVYLTDHKTSITQKLNDNPVYEFTAQEDDTPERFELYFGTLDIDDNDDVSSKMNVFVLDRNIEIRSNNPVNATIYLYNIAGQLITRSKLNNESSSSIDTKGFEGVAIVSVVSNKQVSNFKVIIR